MSLLASTLNMDDNMGLGTPNFFNSAWDPEHNDFALTDNYPTDSDGCYDDFVQGFQSHAQQDQTDYFSSHPGNRFPAEHYVSEYDSSILGPSVDLNQILESHGGKGILESSLAQGVTRSTATPQSLNPFEFSNRGDRVRAASATSGDSTVLGAPGLEDQSMDHWGLDVKPGFPVGIKFNERKTSVLYGQITPGDSPVEDRLPALKTSPSPITQLPEDLLASKKRKAQPAASMGTEEPGGNAEPAPRARRPRKSKKKALTKEQEDAKRKKFLERNRVAADKCRQNRKKWIDDLQVKAHFFTADNAAKKSALEKLEHDVSQLKALLFVHSGRCTDKNIVNWLEQESARAKRRTETMPKYVSGDVSQGLDDIMSSLGRPFPTRDLGTASHARQVTNGGDDDASILISCESPSKDLDRPSTALDGMTGQVAVKPEKWEQ